MSGGRERLNLPVTDVIRPIATVHVVAGDVESLIECEHSGFHAKLIELIGLWRVGGSGHTGVLNLWLQRPPQLASNSTS